LCGSGAATTTDDRTSDPYNGPYDSIHCGGRIDFEQNWIATAMVEKSAFAALLKRFRLEANLSQEELAERARVSVEGISSLERGVRRIPHRETVDLLALGLALSPEQRAEFAAAASRRRLPGEPHSAALGKEDNLPAPRTSFFGRTSEISDVESLLGKHRLVTILGPGGVGKTRLALEMGVRALGSYRDGIWFVELADLARGDSISSVIARTMGLQSAPEQAWPEAFLPALRAKQALLILDNCEHLVAEAARVVDEVTRACPLIAVLATSREALGVAGEEAYRLPSLAMPASQINGRLSAADAMQFAAIALFVDRARSADKAFTLADADVPAVDQIVRRLDGIPLAIELAAPRVKVLSLVQLREMLERRFSLLSGPGRAALPRQQTMKLTIDWSYDLLSEKERKLFRRVAVFSSGWTLVAAEQVCVLDGEAVADVLDVLASLIDKSLVVAEPGGAETRYRLLELTRRYALDRLREGGEGQPVARRHADLYLRLVRRSVEAWGTVPIARWRASYEADIENERAALGWLRDAANAAALADPADSVELLELSGDLAIMRSAPHEAAVEFAQAIEALSELSPSPTRERRELALRTKLGPALMVASGEGAAEVRTNYERALALAEKLGDPVGRFNAVWGLWKRSSTAKITLAVQREQAERAAELFGLAEQLKDDQFRLSALHARWAGLWIGRSLADVIADAEAGSRLYDPQRHSAQAFTYGGHDPLVCGYNHAAIAYALMGRFTRAREMVGEAVAIATSMAHPFILLHGLNHAAIAYQLAGDAEGCASASLTLRQVAEEGGFSTALAWSRIFEGWCRVRQGDARAGIVLMARAARRILALRGGATSPYCFGLLADVALEHGEGALAQEFIESAFDGYGEGCRGMYLSDIERVRATILALDRGRQGEAREAFRSAIEHAREQGALAAELRAALAYAKARLSVEDTHAASENVRNALLSIEADSKVDVVGKAMSFLSELDG